jgi:putative protein-disulfide isomerase
LTRLRQSLPVGIDFQSVLGGLAPDNNQPMDEQTRQMVQGHWRKIQATVGTEFNFDFWDKCNPSRDTYKASRAVVAASFQQAGEEMLEAIQRAFYLRAMDPSDPSTHFRLAQELGLDLPRFEHDFGSATTEMEFQRHLMLRAELNVWSFPSLVLERHSGKTLIRHDYHSYKTTLEQIRHLVNS